MDRILQLKITLLGSKPPIWRRVLVDKCITFESLHQIIQVAMGWDGSHLYEFDINGNTIAVPDFEFDPEDSEEYLDSRMTRMESIITQEKQKFIYLYDFGDNWEHGIQVEKKLPLDPKLTYPVCIDGALNCPPEDIGGIYAFYEILKAVNDENHPDHEEMIEYIDEDYDPEYFDLDDINEYMSITFKN